MTARRTYRGLFALLAVLFGVLLAATVAYGASAYGSRPPEMKINYKGVTLQKPKTIG